MKSLSRLSRKTILVFILIPIGFAILIGLWALSSGKLAETYITSTYKLPFDAQNPETTSQTINKLWSDWVKSQNNRSPQPTMVINSLLQDTGAKSLNLDIAFVNRFNRVNNPEINLSGYINNQGLNLSGKVSGTTSKNNPVSAQLELIISQNTIYVKISQIADTVTELGAAATFLKSISDTWVSLPLTTFQSLPTTSLLNVLSDSKVTFPQLVADFWDKHALFVNPEAKESTLIQGQTCAGLQLNTDDLQIVDKKLFSDLWWLVCTQPQGKLPLNIGLQKGTTKTGWELAIGITGFGAEKSILLPEATNLSDAFANYLISVGT